MSWWEHMVSLDDAACKRAMESMWADERKWFVPHTLCEICANACGFCSWSEKDVQQPVPGWEAIRADLVERQTGGQPRTVESYVVVKCPQFVLEEQYAKYYEAFGADTAQKQLEWRKVSSRRREKRNA